MRVRLLGPVDVVVGGEPRAVHGLRRKAVLAVLALHGGEVVSTDCLAEAVWGDAAPPQALRIFDEIDHPDRDWVRAKLRVDDHEETADRELAAQLNSA